MPLTPSAAATVLDLHRVLLAQAGELRLTVRALLELAHRNELALVAERAEAQRLAVRCRRLEDELARLGLSEVEISAAAGDTPEHA